MSSHSDRFRSRTGLIPPGFKFPGFQSLCMGGLDSSAYLSSTMGSPAVMVLTSTGGDVSPHVQGQVTFPRQRMDKDGGAHVPFPPPSFPVRPLFGQGDPYASLSSPLLSLHHPLLATHTLGRSYLNASGAFRPLGITEDRNGFHGSAFVPAKCMKLDQSPSDLSSPQHLLIPSCYQGNDTSFQSPANSHASTGSLHGGSGLGSFLDVKDDDHRDSDSIVDGPDRLTETPISEESRSIDRSTPEDRGTPKRRNDNKHHQGVGLLLSIHASDALLGYECINERFLTAKFETSIKDLDVICCYAPTEDANEDEKDRFYGQFQDILNSVKKGDITLVLGDFNAKVGTDSDLWGGVTGPFGIGSCNGKRSPSGHKKYFLDGQNPFCPICGTTLQLSELSTHFEMEVDRLLEMSKCITQQTEVSPLRSPFSSPLCVVRKEGNEKGKPESRWETYQRVKVNRQNRLSSRACIGKRKKWEESASPVSSERNDEGPAHLLVPGLRKRESQDVEGETADSHTAAEQFNWAVSARLHAIAQFQRGLAESYTRKFEAAEDENQELNVDGDDSATYGQPHYTEADVITCSTEDASENKDQIRRIQVSESNNYQRVSDSNKWNINGGGTNGEGQEVTSTCVNNNDAGEFHTEKSAKPIKESGENPKEHEQVEEGIKCLICMEPFIKPVVSICCWHVHCEECWLKTLGTKKLCPQCNMITSPRDLRRIYL